MIKINKCEEVAVAKPYELVISVDKEDIEKFKQENWNQIKDQVEMKGFRKGKVPRETFESKNGEFNVHGGFIISKLDEFIDKTQYPVLEYLDRNLNKNDNECWEYRTSVYFLPNVELSEDLINELDSEEFGIDIDPIDIDKLVEVAVEGRINSIKDTHQKHIPKDFPVEDGDVAVLNCSSHFKDGTKFEEGCFKNNKMLIKEGAVRPEEVYEAIKNSHEGTTSIAHYSLPDTHPKAGEEISVAINIKQLFKAENPDVDDDLAVSAGYKDKNVMMDIITKAAYEYAEMSKKDTIRDVIADKIFVNSTPDPIPSSWIQNRAIQAWQDGVRNLGNEEDALKWVGASMLYQVCLEL